MARVRRDTIRFFFNVDCLCQHCLRQHPVVPLSQPVLEQCKGMVVSMEFKGCYFNSSITNRAMTDQLQSACREGKGKGKRAYPHRVIQSSDFPLPFPEGALDLPYHRTVRCTAGETKALKLHVHCLPVRCSSKDCSNAHGDILPHLAAVYPWLVTCSCIVDMPAISGRCMVHAAT